VTNTPGESIGAYLTWNGDRIGLSGPTRRQADEVYSETFVSTGTTREPARRLTADATWSLTPAIRPDGDGLVGGNEYQPET
jgi:hypothetical protein